MLGQPRMLSEVTSFQNLLQQKFTSSFIYRNQKTLLLHAKHFLHHIHYSTGKLSKSKKP